MNSHDNNQENVEEEKGMELVDQVQDESETEESKLPTIFVDRCHDEDNRNGDQRGWNPAETDEVQHYYAYEVE